VERSQKVHGEARAGDDPAGMDAGSRPLTMDGNWPSRSAFSSRAAPTGVAQGWGKRNVQLEPAGSAKRGLEMARRTWTSAAGSANMEVSSAGKANREPELSCKTCLKRTLKQAPTFATPTLIGINEAAPHRAALGKAIF